MKSKPVLRTLAVALFAVVAAASAVHAQDVPAAPPEGKPAAAAAVPGPAVRKGMTWGTYPHDPVTGAANVSCQGAPASPNINQGACDPYKGDTPGTTRLPVLCFKKLGLPNPVPNVSPPSDPGYWSGGVIATTPPVSPIAMGWLAQPRSMVDAYCVKQFGAGWQVAEFHMGQNKGWKFGAYGNVGKPGVERFWVHVNDQPNGNVWNP